MSHKSARAMLVGLTAVVLLGVAIAPVAAKTAKVTGTLVLPADAAAPGATAVAVVTLIDATNTSDSGNIIGQQRIDGIGATPVAFAVAFEADTIDKTHAYALFATVVDGSSTWQNPTGVPVITGGPVEGVKVPISPQITGNSTIEGSLLLPKGTTAGPGSVAIAALIKQDTGTLVSRQVQPTVSGVAPAFSISFDSSLIDPAATYVVKAAIVTGAKVWENQTGVPAISGGDASTGLTVALTTTTANIPVPTTAPTAAPTAKPTAKPTPAPTKSASPTDKPTGPDGQADRGPDRHAHTGAE